jgi:hypothetical protein
MLFQKKERVPTSKDIVYLCEAARGDMSLSKEEFVHELWKNGVHVSIFTYSRWTNENSDRLPNKKFCQEIESVLIKWGFLN